MGNFEEVFHGALARFIENETGDKVITIHNVGTEQYSPGSERWLDVSYKSEIREYEYYTWRGEFAELMRRLTVD